MEIKTRTFPESNYKATYFDGKTLRFAIDETKPITELEYPEFYDVKLTGQCKGECSYCYMSSNKEEKHYENVINKIKNFFGNLTENQKPFQVAIGGGEPTEHPDFKKVLKTFVELGITPNYTTNGMWVQDMIESKRIVKATKNYCGGVALSCHAHLDQFWKPAANLLLKKGVIVNLHIIISDKASIDRFQNIFNEYKYKVEYFVLLPLIAQGRAKESTMEWDYLKSKIQNTGKIAFGAKFYPYLQKDKDYSNKADISLYQPEIMSKFLDLKDMKIYKSSFETT